MNYARIYREFISDRMAKQPEAPTYFERHHILPRALGGGDEPENLIRLTPEDHLFAHLLLAKIHGGSMWAAVHAMCYLANSRSDGCRRFGSREKFGYVRRALASYFRESFSGPDGPQADKRKYTLHHLDGRTASGNRFELEAATGIPRQQISALLRGAKKNAGGWHSREHNPLGLTRSQLISMGLRSSEIWTLYHHDGREWSGTRADFAEEFGSPLTFQSPTGSVLGWHRTRDDASRYSERQKQKSLNASRARGDISGAANPMYGVDRRKSRRIKVRHKTGEVYAGCSIEFAERIGAGERTAYQRMMKTLRGKRIVKGCAVKTFKGWTPIEVQE